MTCMLSLNYWHISFNNNIHSNSTVLLVLLLLLEWKVFLYWLVLSTGITLLNEHRRYSGSL